MKCSNTIVAALRATMIALETRAGRRAFWATVCTVLVVMGFLAVRRAEFPERKFLKCLNYPSPTSIPEGTAPDGQAQWRSSEFRGFRSIAWGTLMEGLDPYKDVNKNLRGKPHIRAYPPFFAIAFFPFAAPWALAGAGSGLFYLTSFLFALAAAWCCSAWADECSQHGDTESTEKESGIRRLGGLSASVVKRTRAGRFGAFVLTFILLAPLAFDVMARCESDMLVLLPVAAAFLWLIRGEKKFRSGALLGFAASFKVLPGLFGVYLLCTRRWRALAGMVCGGLVCTVLLPVLVWGPQRAWDLHLSWYRNVVAPYSAGGAQDFLKDAYRPSNQSLTAGLNRLLRRLPATEGKADESVNLVSLPEGVVKLLVKALQAAIVLGLVLLWVMFGQGRAVLCGGRTADRDTSFRQNPQSAVRNPQSEAALMAAVAPGILLLSEVSLTTHHVLLILPLAAVLIRILILEDAAASRWGWVFVVYLLALAGVAIPAVKPYTPLLPATAVLLAVCVALTLLDRMADPEGTVERAAL